MSALRWFAFIISLGLIGLGVSALEGARGGLSIEDTQVGSTPVSVYRLPGQGQAPAVVVAHGIGASRQVMEGYALSLAHAGYVVVSLDFAGHGRHSDALHGNATQQADIMIAQVREVVTYALGLPWVDGRIALLGHATAADIVIREAATDTRIGPVIALSSLSSATTPQHPDMLLMINGAWADDQRAQSLQALHQINPAATEARTVGGAGVLRRAVATPLSGQFGVLYSLTGMAEARDWLNLAYGRTGTGPRNNTGAAILCLLLGIFLLAWPLSGFLAEDEAPEALTQGEFWIAALVPAIVTPLVLSPLETQFLPIVLADYLALHMLIYGAWTVLILRGFGHVTEPPHGTTAAVLVLFGIVLFGGMMDRYVTAFLPAGIRPFLFIVIALGTVPYMFGETKLLEAGNAGFAYSIAARVCFVGSLLVATVLDPHRLEFMWVILPLILIYFVVFGTIGGWFGRRTGSVSAVGYGLGIVLAWVLAVSLPMIAP